VAVCRERWLCVAKRLPASFYSSPSSSAAAEVSADELETIAPTITGAIDAAAVGAVVISDSLTSSSTSSTSSLPSPSRSFRVPRPAACACPHCACACRPHHDHLLMRCS
jgi:hypothetical protein